MLHRLLLCEHLSSQRSLRDHFTSTLAHIGHNCATKTNLTLAEGTGSGHINSYSIKHIIIDASWYSGRGREVFWGRYRFRCVQLMAVFILGDSSALTKAGKLVPMLPAATSPQVRLELCPGHTFLLGWCKVTSKQYSRTHLNSKTPTGKQPYTLPLQPSTMDKG